MPGNFAYNPSTNTVTVTGGTSGSPADFASFVAADRAGTLTLKAATPPALGIALATQIQPCEKLALLITFVLAGTNAGAGDTINITGTDAWGNAQTESLSVAVGNGIYVSAKRWRTITSFSCTGFNDGVGTVTVTQPQWGVICDKGYGQYQIDCLINCGDGSTSTYFGDASKQIIFKPSLGAYGTSYITVNANATLRLGTLLNATNFTTENGCNILASESNWNINLIYSNAATATVLLYSTSIFSYGSNHLSVNLLHNSSQNHIFNVLISGNQIYSSVSFQSGTNSIINNLQLVRGNAMDIGSDVESMTVVLAQIYCSWGNTAMFKNVTVIDPPNGEYITTNGFIATASLLDCTLEWVIHWDGYSGSSKIYRKNTIELTVNDINGDPITGATVTLKDKTDTEVFSVTTGVDGIIESQIVTRGYYDQAHDDVLQDYGPHTLTITADGYQDYQDVITIDRKMDLEVALLAVVASGGGVSPTNLGLVPLGIKQVAV